MMSHEEMMGVVATEAAESIHASQPEAESEEWTSLGAKEIDIGTWAAAIKTGPSESDIFAVMVPSKEDAEQIAAQICESMNFKAQWDADSSLEKWFPLTAEELEKKSKALDAFCSDDALAIKELIFKAQQAKQKAEAEVERFREILENLAEAVKWANHISQNEKGSK